MDFSHTPLTCKVSTISTIYSAKLGFQYELAHARLNTYLYMGSDRIWIALKTGISYYDSNINTPSIELEFSTDSRTQQFISKVFSSFFANQITMTNHKLIQDQFNTSISINEMRLLNLQLCQIMREANQLLADSIVKFKADNHALLTSRISRNAQKELLNSIKKINGCEIEKIQSKLKSDYRCKTTDKLDSESRLFLESLLEKLVLNDTNFKNYFDNING